MKVIENIKGSTRDFSMNELYASIGMTRQAVHQKKKLLESKKLVIDKLVEQIKTVRSQHPHMGSRPMYYNLGEMGIDVPMGINSFENLVKEEGLSVGKARAKYQKTSDGLGKENYSNLTNGLIINDINKLIAADITYFEIEECRCYLFVLKDVYSQRVLSLMPSRNMYSENAVECLKDMVKLRNTTNFEDCIHHSDNGSQYNSKLYKSQLSSMKISISRAESCKQNGSVEQMNHIIKNMYLENWAIATFKELQQACKEFLYLNNENRTIKQLGFLSPAKFEAKIRKMNACERPIKRMHDFENGF